MTFTRTRLALLGAVGALVLVGGAIVALLLSQSDPEPIKIGVLLPLSGVGAEEGTEILSGIQFVADDANVRDGLNGRPIRLVVGDTKSDSMEAIRVLEQMEIEHQPSMYVSYSSSVGVALAPITEVTCPRCLYHSLC